MRPNLIRQLQNTRILVRVVLLLAFMVTMSLSVSGALSLRHSENAMRMSLETRARVHASTAAGILAAPLFMEDDAEIAKLVNGLKSADSAISEINVAGVADSSTRFAGEPWRSLAAQTGVDAEPAVVRIDDEGIAAFTRVGFDGEDVGAVAVRMSGEEVVFLRSKVIKSTVLSGLIVLALSLLAATAFIRVSIEVPLQRTVSIIKSVSAGDLTRRLNTSTQDEFGVMGRSLNAALDQIAHTVRSIANSATTLNGASEKLRSVSEVMSSESGTSSRMASDVSDAVAGIAANSNEAANVADDAVKMMQSMNRMFEELKSNSKQIDAVVDVINSVAMQTNLLALNASVEAARAGDAGAGFAVVADEVNALSKRTSDATGKISKMVDGIQGEIKGASDSVVDVEKVICRINVIQNAIAATIGGTDHHRDPGIASNVFKVSASAREVDLNAKVTMQSSAELAHMAEDLTSLIASFKY